MSAVGGGLLRRGLPGGQRPVRALGRTAPPGRPGSRPPRAPQRGRLCRAGMRAVVQRVLRASVEVDGEVVSEIGPGLLALVGIRDTDTDKDLDYICRKVLGVRLWPDEEKGKAWDKSVTAMGECTLGRAAGAGGFSPWSPRTDQGEKVTRCCSCRNSRCSGTPAATSPTSISR